MPKVELKPDYHYEYPTNRRYYDTSKATIGDLSVFDPAKTGGDYGIENLGKVSAEVPVTGVTVSPKTKSLAVGATQQLTATIAPTDASIKSVKYSTSDATKATVSASGLVTGVAAGTATITVTTDDGSKTDTCAVTVTA